MLGSNCFGHYKMGGENKFQKKLEKNNEWIQNYTEERGVKQPVYNNQSFSELNSL